MNSPARSVHWIDSAFLTLDGANSTSRVKLLVDKLRPSWIVFKTEHEYYVISAAEFRKVADSVRDVEAPASCLLNLAHPAAVLPLRSQSLHSAVGPADRAVAVGKDGRVLRVGMISRRVSEANRAGLKRSSARKPSLKGQFSTFRGARQHPKAGPLRRRTSHTVVPVFFATDRLAFTSVNGKPSFSSERSETGALHYGTCNVSIPRSHKMGEIESPLRFWKFEFPRNPEKHLVLLSCKPYSSRGFFQRVAERAVNTKREAFVFVHGYNVKFEDAVLRTAQIAYDLEFPGAPILFSWPSKGSEAAYPADEATIDWSRHHFRDFLEKLALKSGLDVIHVIAHSMGNRIVMRAIESLENKRHSRKRPVLNHIVLTAPDIDSGEFMQLAKEIRSSARRITLYASSRDKALMLSRRFHKAPRAGESGPNIIVADELDTIDATTADTSLMAHSYFAKRRTVLSDIYYLLRGNPPEQRHGLQRQSHQNGTYWAMKA